jgi:hypothetical protein
MTKLHTIDESRGEVMIGENYTANVEKEDRHVKCFRCGCTNTIVLYFVNDMFTYGGGRKLLPYNDNLCLEMAQIIRRQNIWVDSLKTENTRLRYILYGIEK